MTEGGGPSRYEGPGALEYAAATREMEMSALRDRFLSLLPARPLALLEVGPGSGRDARAFVELGHRLEAIDPNPAMARIASEFAGIKVQILRAQDLDREAAFDGIWACASLLHVPRLELPETFRRVGRALRPGGVLYASFKLGREERTVEGLAYTHMDEDRVREVVVQVSDLEIVDLWRTEDLRPRPSQPLWINVLLERPITPDSGAPPMLSPEG